MLFAWLRIFASDIILGHILFPLGYWDFLDGWYTKGWSVIFSWLKIFASNVILGHIPFSLMRFTPALMHKWMISVGCLPRLWHQTLYTRAYFPHFGKMINHLPHLHSSSVHLKDFHFYMSSHFSRDFIMWLHQSIFKSRFFSLYNSWQSIF